MTLEWIANARGSGNWAFFEKGHDRFSRSGGHRRLSVAGALAACIISWLSACPMPGAESDQQKSEPHLGGVGVIPGYPDAFAFGYSLADDSISPDGKYGFIYADVEGQINESVVRNFLVALEPFQILAVAEGRPHYGTRTEMKVQWTKDSSAVLLHIEGKWGPVGFTLFELREGRVTRRTNLFAEIEKLIQPGFRRSGAYNEASNLILDRDGGGDRDHEPHLDPDGKRIHFDVFGTSNPKPMEPPIKTWGGHLNAVWSIPEARWLSHKVTNTTYRQ